MSPRLRFAPMVRVWLTAATLAASVAACGSIAGTECGNAMYAFAVVTTPDTGIAARSEIHVALTQHDPDIVGEVTDISIQHVWPASRGVNPEPDPRVRLVRDDGVVLLDTLATRRLPDDLADRPSWVVVRRTTRAEDRIALYEALRTETVSLELWARDASAPGSRIRLRPREIGTTPPARCL